MPHTEHLSYDDVNVTSPGDDHRVDLDDGDGVEEEIDDAGASVEMVWKGLVVVAGIYVFFVAERLISLCRTVRRRSSNKVP